MAMCEVLECLQIFDIYSNSDGGRMETKCGRLARDK